ncbi:hypothetical protein F5Y10DRAFT_243965 [Nemania abortiva]|nr:hypothetical protein F5Y10DRAFT_243965 [Nemania abortiva]
MVGPKLTPNSTPPAPALATITYGGPSRRIANITISPPANAFSSTLARSETLSLGGSRSHRRSFSITTTASAGRRQRVEAFEWRHSYGPEVESLGGSRDDGWKLVRMSSSDARGAVRHTFPSLYLAKRYPSKVGTSSDGKEVVAVWCAAGLGRSFSSKCMRFRFLGSGADGSLGQRWAVMAVASALAMWHND